MSPIWIIFVILLYIAFAELFIYSTRLYLQQKAWLPLALNLIVVTLLVVSAFQK